MINPEFPSQTPVDTQAATAGPSSEISTLELAQKHIERHFPKLLEPGNEAALQDYREALAAYLDPKITPGELLLEGDDWS